MHHHSLTYGTLVALVLLLTLGLVAGCSPSTPIGEPFPSPRAYASNTPTRIIILTATRTPKPAPTPTKTPTWTPTSEAFAAEMRATLQALYIDNASCRLPCWWGINPGSTTWEDARKELEDIWVTNYSNKSGEIESYEVMIPPESDRYHQILRRHHYLVVNGIVREIEIDINSLWPYADLEWIVEAYGKPDEIWVHTGTAAVQSNELITEFSLILFYKSLGVMVGYDDDQAEFNDREIIACLHEQSGGNTLLLWDSTTKYSFEEKLDNSLGFFKEATYLPLEIATDLSVDEYFESLENQSPVCLKTPRGLWSK